MSDNREQVFKSNSEINRTVYGNDFMSKFGTSGGGAPLRDSYGNPIASRKP